MSVSDPKSDLHPSWGWNGARTAELKRRWAAGETGTCIGRALGVGRGGVIGKINRLGLSKEARAIAIAPGTRQRSLTQVRAPKAPPVAGEPMRTVNARAIAGQQRIIAIADGVSAPILPLPPQTIVDTGVEPKPWMERTLLECTWPIGEGHNLRSCCAPIARGSWCERHAEIGFVRTANVGRMYERSLRRYG